MPARTSGKSIFTEAGGAPPGTDEKNRLLGEIKAQKLQLENESLADKLANLKGESGTASPFTMASGKTQSIGGSVSLDRLYGTTEPGGIHGLLGVSSPSGGTNTNLFTVLSKHTCNISVLWVANRRLISAKVRVGFDVGGGGTNIVPDGAWLYHNVEVPGESTLVLDAATGLWLAKDDDVVVRTDVSGVSFGASGILYATV